MNEDLTLRELGESAINLAVQNVLDGGGPFGAIVVKDGKIIASGANSVTTTNDPAAPVFFRHAPGDWPLLQNSTQRRDLRRRSGRCGPAAG